MSTRDLTELRRWLDALPDAARRVSSALDDLHSLAFDRHVGESAGRATRTDWALDAVGDREAKDLWRRLRRSVFASLVELESACQVVSHLLGKGGMPDRTMRGTLLGDDGEGATEELKRLMAAKQRRKDRGDFDSQRQMPQPGVPRR